MTNISEIAPPSGALTGLERIPGLKGADNVGIPLFAITGIPRGTVLALARPFLADTASTADADPGAGNLRWNHATQASATVIYIDDVDTLAADIAAALATLTVGGFLWLQAPGPADKNIWQKWQVASITDAAGYTKIGVTLSASAGSFADNGEILLSVQQPDTTSAGDVVGPAGAADDEVVLFNGATGKAVKSSGRKLTPNVQTVVSAATVTPTFANDLVKVTAQGVALALANPSGTAIPGHGIVIRLKDNGTARAITYGTKYRALGITLPTTTVASKTTYLGMIYNSDDDMWDVVATGTQA